jgi:hypothetical protein
VQLRHRRMRERGERRARDAVEGMVRLACVLCREHEVAQRRPQSGGCPDEWVRRVWVRKECAGRIEEARLEARAEGRVEWVTGIGRNGCAYCDDPERWMCGNKARISCVRRRKKQMSVRMKDMCTIVEVSMSVTYELGPAHRRNIRVIELHFAVLKEVVKHLERDSKGRREKLGNTYGHDTTFCLLDAFYDEDTAGLDSTHSGAVDIHKVSTVSDLPALLELCLTNITMQGDILIFCVQ